MAYFQDCPLGFCCHLCPFFAKTQGGSVSLSCQGPNGAEQFEVSFFEFIQSECLWFSICLPALNFPLPYAALEPETRPEAGGVVGCW